ncbi:hypothetical protein EON82_01530 [bacterium]|nr:MAG: hypothetical protein EON82_01530 [bacterium]
MADAHCRPLDETLEELERIAPGAPLLALGQTVFWDEPMKAGLALRLKALGSSRRLVAGSHDTDYFAKLPGEKGRRSRFRAVPHNDTTTKGLWSAAGEFSALFGGETVVTRETMAAAGARLARIEHDRPGFLDEATEAFGWRGVVANDERVPITAELPIKYALPELKATLDWALRETTACLAGSARDIGEDRADDLRKLMCDVADERQGSVGEYYERMLPELYSFVAGERVDVDTTSTTRLLGFNRETCGLPRFGLLDLFVRGETKALAKAAYDEAVAHGPGMFPLGRFGTGAVPFDVVVPGMGRGTLRIGNRGLVIMTPTPQFLSFDEPLTGVADLAEKLESKFGPDCTIVGKAVALIGMLASEFVFAFHEGASSYVKVSRAMHERLRETLGVELRLNPILRVRYSTWNAMRPVNAWLRLPGVLQRAFGTEELSAASFAERWAVVGNEQEELLAELGRCKKSNCLIKMLDRRLGGAWKCLSEEYLRLHADLEALEGEMADLLRERDEAYARLRECRRARVQAEWAKGEHWRAEIFEKKPTAEVTAERTWLSDAVEAAIHATSQAEAALRSVRARQAQRVGDPRVMNARARRREIELEAELKRVRLVREAVVSSRGLRAAERRPSAWWLPVVSPDGTWFRETVRTAQAWLEPL